MGRALRKSPLRLPQFLRDELYPIRQDEGPLVRYLGKPIKEVKNSWRKAKKRAGLDVKVTTYSFRHTLSRFMRANRVPYDQIQVQLGHVMSAVTDRYAAFSPDYLKEAVACIDEFWCRVRDSNPRPLDYKSSALPAELTRLSKVLSVGLPVDGRFLNCHIDNLPVGHRITNQVLYRLS
jgi:hypothetical protein